MKLNSFFMIFWVCGFLITGLSAVSAQTQSQSFNDLLLPVNVCGEVVVMGVDVHILSDNGKVSHINTQGTGENAAGDSYQFNLNFNTHNSLNLNGGGTHCINLSTRIIGEGQAPNVITHSVHCFQLGTNGLVELVSLDTQNSNCGD